MAHDYKHAGKTSSSPSGKVPPPGWLWFLAGLTVGLFIAVLTYLSAQHSGGGTEQRANVQSEVRSERPVNPQKKPPDPSESDRVASTTKPNEKRPKPRFEFYTILPEREIRVSEHELRSQEQQQAPQKTEIPTTASVAGSYILQVGSFRYLGDADQLKAKLVLSGFDVEIQTVSTNNNDTWYRVRLGPYQDLGTVHRIRAALQKNGFASLVLKEKL